MKENERDCTHLFTTECFQSKTLNLLITALLLLEIYFPMEK